jgi:hypothetical protein
MSWRIRWDELTGDENDELRTEPVKAVCKEGRAWWVTVAPNSNHGGQMNPLIEKKKKNDSSASLNSNKFGRYMAKKLSRQKIDVNNDDHRECELETVSSQNGGRHEKSVKGVNALQKIQVSSFSGFF